MTKNTILKILALSILSGATNASASGGGSVPGTTANSDSGTTVLVDNSSGSAHSTEGRGGTRDGSEYRFRLEQTPDEKKDLGHCKLWFDGSYAVPLNSSFKSMTHFGLTVAVESDHHQIGVGIGGGFVDFRHGSAAEAAISHNAMVNFGFNYRFYPLSYHRPVSPYLTASWEIGHFGWDYRSPITVGGKTIDSDGALTMSGYAGVGISTRRDRKVTFFAEADFGGMGFGSPTDRGFKNDVFDGFSYVNARAGLTIRF